MSLRPPHLLAAFVSAAALLSARAETLVLTNARVYTANDSAPRAEAVVATDGKIIFVGSAADAKARTPAGARVIDLHGATVLPGFTDAHAHLAGVGFRELTFNLEGTTGIADLRAKLKARAATTAKGAWLVGRGWIESKWSPPAFPTCADLDAAAPDHPVVLGRSDGHALVANSLALQLAHLDRATPNPAGGEILHDAAGEPTGMLIDNAQALVRRLVPAATDEETAHALEVGAAREVTLGWTQVHSAGNSYTEAKLMERLIREGKIKLRISDTISAPTADATRLMDEGATIDEFGGRFTLRGLKLYMDGALGSRGAALLEPYSDSPDRTGLFLTTPEQIYPVLVRALKTGIQIQTHAIGDRGNRTILDLYEKAFAEVPVAQRKVANPRWRVEHAQIISPVDIPRFAKLGVLPSMQASHAIGDLSFAPARLGAARLKGAYAWRSLIDAGSIIPGGSDAPVERGEPMIEFYAAVARKALDGFSNDDWHREERVTRVEALKMFTRWPAYAVFQENERGTIEVGKAADFTVLSADIMEIPEAEILKTTCVMAVIGGEIVFRK